MREREKESALSACLACIYIFSEPGLSALYPGFITDWVLSKDTKIPWMLSNLCPTTFCFLRPPFFFLPEAFFFHSAHKRCWFSFWDGCAGKGGRQRQRKRQNNELAQAQDKTQREGVNTKLLLRLTLKRPVSSTPLPPFPSSPLLAFSVPPVYSGLERGLASPAVSSVLCLSIFWFSLCRSLHFLPWKKKRTQKQ